MAAVSVKWSNRRDGENNGLLAGFSLLTRPSRFPRAPNPLSFTVRILNQFVLFNLGEKWRCRNIQLDFKESLFFF